MNVVMPIAGRGSRFIAQGFTDPKPLINILGKPMIQWATDAVPFLTDNRFIFIVRRDHLDDYEIDKRLKELYPTVDVNIVVVDEITEGAACTVLLAKDYINNDDELIIYNTDQFFKSDLESKMRDKEAYVAGIVPVFHATHPKWSFAKINSDGYVTEVKEKEPISTHATVGLYYFTRGRDFVWAAEQMIRKDIRVNGEFYVCPVYNELIERGDKIILSHCDFMWGLGTPEDVARFEKYYQG